MAKSKSTIGMIKFFYSGGYRARPNPVSNYDDPSLSKLKAFGKLYQQETAAQLGITDTSRAKESKLPAACS